MNSNLHVLYVGRVDFEDEISEQFQYSMNSDKFLSQKEGKLYRILKYKYNRAFRK